MLPFAAALLACLACLVLADTSHPCVVQLDGRVLSVFPASLRGVKRRKAQPLPFAAPHLTQPRPDDARQLHVTIEFIPFRPTGYITKRDICCVARVQDQAWISTSRAGLVPCRCSTLQADVKSQCSCAVQAQECDYRFVLQLMSCHGDHTGHRCRHILVLLALLSAQGYGPTGTITTACVLRLPASLKTGRLEPGLAFRRLRYAGLRG